MRSKASHQSIRTTILAEIQTLMQRLDQRLTQAITTISRTQEAEITADPYRGLHIDLPEVLQLLAQEPGIAPFPLPLETTSLLSLIQPKSRLAWFWETFNLSAFDLDVVAIALAPEFDPRYERLYAYLQDDITRKRPTIDLALNLLSSDAVTKWEGRDRFSPDAPLIRTGLLQLIPDPHQTQPPFLSFYLKLDEQVSRFLLGQSGLDPQLEVSCELIQPTATLDHLFLASEIKQGLRSLTQEFNQTRQPLSMYFQGVSGLGQRTAAEALAAEVNRSLLRVNLTQILEPKTSFPQRLKRVQREALFQNAVLYLEGGDSFSVEDYALLNSQLFADSSLTQNMVILTGAQPRIPSAANLISVPFTSLDFADRRAYWQTKLAEVNITLAVSDLNALADRFRLTVDQIDQAIATTCKTLHWEAACSLQPRSLENCETVLFAATRAQSGQDLATLVRKIPAKQTWDNLVLPSQQQEQLRAICNQVKHRRLVYEEWGFEGKLSLGKGLSVLFAGPPGTGKTMAAEAIAHELQLDLYKIDLSQVVSKYIGETEKNLERIFTTAENANAILLFDEADAIFGKRSEVKDAHDRYANLEVAYLLQKMEEYEGISILTSNLRQNMDDAFTRRIRFIVEFPFPEEAARLQIWQQIFPSEMPLAHDVNLKLLAQQFKITGGSIRNIALTSAFLAADDGQVVKINHLIKATRQEFQKMGRMINETEFLPFQNRKKS